MIARPPPLVVWLAALAISCSDEGTASPTQAPPAPSSAIPAASSNTASAADSISAAPAPPPIIDKRLAECCASLQQTPPSIGPEHADAMKRAAETCQRIPIDPTQDPKKALLRIQRTLPATIRSRFPRRAPEPLF